MGQHYIGCQHSTLLVLNGQPDAVLLVFRNTLLILLCPLLHKFHHSFPLPEYSYHQLSGRQPLFKLFLLVSWMCVHPLRWLLFGFNIHKWNPSFITCYSSQRLSTLGAPTRGDCLTTASASDSAWSVCLQNLSRFLSRHSRYRLCKDPTENTIALLMWVMRYCVFRCSATFRLMPDRVATSLPAALLSFCDGPTVAETMYLSSRSLAMAVSLDPLLRLLRRHFTK
jgi:hypothetical protein